MPKLRRRLDAVIPQWKIPLPNGNKVAPEERAAKRLPGERSDLPALPALLLHSEADRRSLAVGYSNLGYAKAPEVVRIWGEP